MYLEIDEGFIAHRKTLRICGMMQDPNAFAYLLRLWSWATRSAPRGDLRGMDPTDIEIVVQYRLMDGKCFRAMVTAGFIDTDADGMPVEIHNWMKRTGGAIARMAAEADRKKLYRAHKEGKCGGRGQCALCDKIIPGRAEDDSDSVRGQSADAGESVQGRSDTDKTSPDKTSQDKKEAAPAPARDPWPAWRWYEKFKVAWPLAHNKVAYGDGDDDAKATGELEDKLNSLPGSDRMKAQAEAEILLARYFGIKAAAGHPWKWFVQRFNELRAGPIAPRSPPRPRGGPDHQRTIDAVNEWAGAGET